MKVICDNFGTQHCNKVHEVTECTHSVSHDSRDACVVGECCASAIGGSTVSIKCQCIEVEEEKVEDQAEKLRELVKGQVIKIPVTNNRFDEVEFLGKKIDFDYQKDYYVFKSESPCEVRISKWGSRGDIIITLGYSSVIVNLELFKDLADTILKHGHDYQYDLIVESGVKIVDEELDKKE